MMDDDGERTGVDECGSSKGRIIAHLPWPAHAPAHTPAHIVLLSRRLSSSQHHEQQQLRRSADGAEASDTKRLGKKERARPAAAAAETK